MEKIGKYRILEKIGEGAMGVVYKALDPLMERVVAVKTMSADLSAEPELRARFLREARSAGQLSHKNIVTIYDLGEEAGRAYMAMEFLDGEDLKSKIVRRERISLEEKLGVMIEICEGLSHAHHKDVIHRDIKPGNIHLTRSGQVKILDFGLARIASSDITRTGSVMGTPNYMSPEQVRGDKVDHRSDLFSAGALFYELLSYRKPFSGPTLPATFFKILQEEPESLEQIDPAVPEQLSAIVRRALAKDPAKRYQHADELLRDLERFRKSLDERKRRLQEEASLAMVRLERLIEENRELLGEEVARLGSAPLWMAAPGGSEETARRLDFSLDYLGILEIFNQAKAEHDRLSVLLSKRKQAGRLFPQAQALEGSGELEKALQVAEKILRDVPGHREAAALAVRAREALSLRARQEEKNHELVRLLAEADELYRRGDWPGSMASLDKALGLDPAHPQAGSLRKKISLRLEEEKLQEQKARQAEELFQKATSKFSEEDWVGCLPLLVQVLKLQPDHLAATALQERAQQRIKEQAELEEKRQEAEELLAEARRALAGGNLNRARREIEQALALHAEAPGALEMFGEIERAEEKLQAREERERRVAKLLEEARSLERSGDGEKALGRLQELLALEREHPPALELKAKLEQQLKARQRAEQERREKIEAALERAREAEKGADFDRASGLARRVLAEEPAHPEALQLLERAQAGLRARKDRERLEREAESLLARSEALARGGDYRAAASVLEEAEPALASLESMKQSLAHYREAARAQEEARQRQRRIEEHLGRGKRAFERGEYAACEEEMTRLLSLAPDHPEAPAYVARARQRMEAEREEQRRLSKLSEAVRAAEQALAAGKLELARQEAQRALALDSGSRDAERVQSEIERRLAEIREREAARQRAQALGEEARQSLEKGNAEGARRSLAEALSLWPDLPAAPKLRKRIDKEMARSSYGRPVETRVSSPPGARASEGAFDSRAPVRAEKFPSSSKSVLLAVAALGLVGLVALLYAVFGSQLRRSEETRPPATDARAVRPAPTEPDPQVSGGLAEALKFFEAQQFAEAAREAQLVLDRSPDNPEAESLLRRAREIGDKIAGGKLRASELYQAGEYEEAMAALSEVLRLAPSDPGARQLLSQLDRYARKSAEEALAQLKEARSKAEGARASELARSAFEEARKLEQDATRLHQAKQFGQATARLLQAQEAYQRAENEAKAEGARSAEQGGQRAAAQRGEAEAAREAYERARATAAQAGAENRVPDPFREAIGLAAEAQASWDQRDFGRSRRGFEQASAAMERALAAAEAGAMAETRREMETARRAMETARSDAPGREPRAEAEESSARELAGQGKLAEAAAAYQRAASLYQAAARSAEGDRQAVLSVLRRYEAALESKDLATLKGIWPSLGGAEERKIRESFEFARSLQVDFQTTDLQVTGESAALTCQRRDQMVSVDGQKVQSEIKTTLLLRKRSGAWIIEAIR